MNLTLTRLYWRPDGVFGQLKGDEYNFTASTLEHAYQQDDGSWLSKIPNGTYNCLRGKHQLSHGGPFETFEIMNVPGHTGVLIHPGNYDDDSEGCILLGSSINQGSVWMVPNSRATFQTFMALQDGVDSFTLTVS